MRFSRVVRASDCQCRSRNSPGFDPSILRHSGVWGAADEAVLNTVHWQKITLFRKSGPLAYVDSRRCTSRWGGWWARALSPSGRPRRPAASPTPAPPGCPARSSSICPWYCYWFRQKEEKSESKMQKWARIETRNSTSSRCFFICKSYRNARYRSLASRFTKGTAAYVKKQNF